MKSLRIWFLLLLAVLLPVRGAMAAAMLCPPAGVGMQGEMRLMDHHAAGHHHQAADGLQHEHDHATHDHSSGGHDDGKSSQDSCNLCTAFCSVTPMVSNPPTVAAPQELSATTFPDLSAPAPSFLSDGQERPPRSI
ncbi:MAG TPA: DUF2946 family protein [Albitalea sp.]|uniref:DUF2946 family protein n=1 Tax=Piscinibacter sp. TaxID=1903157 RepID=UPI002ED25556